MGVREQVHRFATTVAPALAATHAPLALGQMPLRAAIGAGRVNALASGQRGKGFQPEINPGLLPSGRQGAHRYVGTRNGDIPAVSFTRDGDGLGCAFQWAGPGDANTPDLRQDERAVIQPCAVTVFLEREGAVARAALEAREARLLTARPAAQERLIELCQARQHVLEQVRELRAQMEGGDALARLHHLRGAVARPHPYKQVDMIGLNGEGEDVPPLLRALALDQLPAACGHWPYQHRFAAPWAPDQVVKDEMDALLIPLIRMCLLHASSIHDNRPTSKGSRAAGLLAQATGA